MTHKESRKKRYAELKEKYSDDILSETITIRCTPFLKQFLKTLSAEQGFYQTAVLSRYLYTEFYRIMEYRGYCSE